MRIYLSQSVSVPEVVGIEVLRFRKICFRKIYLLVCERHLVEVVPCRVIGVVLLEDRLQHGLCRLLVAGVQTLNRHHDHVLQTPRAVLRHSRHGQKHN